MRRLEAVELNYFKTPQHENGVLIASASDYNRFAALIGEKELSLGKIRPL